MGTITIVNAKELNGNNIEYKKAYENIMYADDNNENLVNAIYNKIKLQTEYSKKYSISSSISNINNKKIESAIESLIKEPSIGGNSYDPKNSVEKIELFLTHKPKISVVSHEQSIDDFSYNIEYLYRKSYDMEKYRYKDYMKLKNNTSIINEENSDYFTIGIYFNYKTDMNYKTRNDYNESVKKNKNVLNDRQMATIFGSLNPKMMLEQTVEFRMYSINFKGYLNMPKIINIWTETSNQLYPCRLIRNQDINNLGFINTGYIVKYSCEKLPNVNDYTGDLKILFD